MLDILLVRLKQLGLELGADSYFLQVGDSLPKLFLNILRLLLHVAYLFLKLVQMLRIPFDIEVLEFVHELELLRREQINMLDRILGQILEVLVHLRQVRRKLHFTGF